MNATSERPSIPEDGCLELYIGSLLEHGSLHRPPSNQEFAQLKTFAIERFNQEDDPSTQREQTLHDITTAAWLMVGSLFRSEIGARQADGRYRLTNQELGTAIAYTLWDRAPGMSATTGATGQTIPDENGQGQYLPPSGAWLNDIKSAIDDGSVQDERVLEQLVRDNVGGIDPQRWDLALDKRAWTSAYQSQYWLAYKVRRFFREWLGYTRIIGHFKDSPFATSGLMQFNHHDQGLLTAYDYFVKSSQTQFVEPTSVEQLDNTIARIVVEDNAVLKTLLTTNRFYLASNTNPVWTEKDWARGPLSKMPAIYGIDHDIGFSREERWVELPADTRVGVLNHPTWLAAHGSNFEDGASLIHRGYWVRENLLCQDVPGLESVNVQAQLPVSDGTLSARQRVHEGIETRIDEATGDRVVNHECMGCHQMMNELGKPFEVFNHAGILRQDDHGSPPDGSAVREHMPSADLNGPVAGPRDFMHRLANSPRVKRCFIRQHFDSLWGVRKQSPMRAP